MGDGNSRIFFDDAVSEQLGNPIEWKFVSFYTYTPELKNQEIDEMNLAEEDFEASGEFIVIRLPALNGSLK